MFKKVLLGFFLFFLSFICLSAFALKAPTPANCIFTITNNWTETLTFNCANDVNLNNSMIQFSVDNPSGLTNLQSVWGFNNIPVYPINPALTVSGNLVSLGLSFPSDPVTLKAKTSTNISFSTNNNVHVVNPVLYISGSTPGVGVLTVAQDTKSDALPPDTTLHIVGQNTSFSTDVVFAIQQQVNQIPLGTYLLSVTGTVNGQPVVIQVIPNQVTFDSSHVNLSTNILYQSTVASLNIAFAGQKPADISTQGVTVHVKDATSTDHPIIVPWNGQANLSGLTAGTSYKLLADAQYGTKNIYSFTFNPATFVASKGLNNASMSMVTTPIPTGVADVTVSGLPSGQTTTLNFTFQNGSGVSQTISFPNISNGEAAYNLPGGYVYNLSAQMVISGGYKYTTNTNLISVQTGQTSFTNLPFTQTAIAGVKGWPNYLAMGAVTDDTSASTTSFQARPIDAIFKYAGMGGNGDPGQIIYPIFTKETAEQAAALTAYYQKHQIPNTVRPVMVIYTAQMSGGTSLTDFEMDTLTKHFITLIMESQKLQDYKSTSNPYPGSIVLNPDLFGMIQQINLIPEVNNAIAAVSLNNALSIAVCFATHTINTTYGQNLTWSDLYKAIRNKTSDDWTAMGIWDQFKMQYYNFCTATPVVPKGIKIPTFTNDFPGWVQINNWIIRQFGPDLTFGWQENLWGIGSANWVHQNYTPAKLKSTIADPTAAVITASTAYSGNYIPDFLVFDKYEMDSIPSATGMGYLYNARDWNNVLQYVGMISNDLGNVPVMLWQIPGGHLQVTNDMDIRINHGSTEPDYFFGDSINPLPLLKSYITAVNLPSSIYGTTQMGSYLSMDETGNPGVYPWSASHLQLAANNHVFAILWGGGNTTSTGVFPSDDNGVLANQIMNYYLSPVPVGRKV